MRTGSKKAGKSLPTVLEVWHLWKERGKEELQTSCGSKKGLARPMEGPVTNLSIGSIPPLARKGSIGIPTNLTHWADAACRKYGLNTKEVVDLEGL